MRNAFLVISGVFFVTHCLFAQQATEKEWRIFQQGVQDYKTGEYQQALKNFSLVIERLGERSNLLTVNYLMLGKTQYKLGDFKAALNTTDLFLKKFSRSAYIDDILFLRANCLYRLNRYQSAVRGWIEVSSSADERLQKKAITLAKDAIRYLLDEQALLNLEKQLDTPQEKKILLYGRAEKYYEAGNSMAALQMLDHYRMLPGSLPQLDQMADDLYQFIKDQKANLLRAAVLLPLSGPEKEIGEAILDGIKLALKDFNRSSELAVQIKTFDYEGDLIKALMLVKQISRDPSFSFIFGPLENDVTAACATIAEYERIPILSPTASGSELQKISDHLIQLAVPVDVMASKLARYVVDSLHIRRAATLAPIDRYFIEFTNTFSNYLKDNFVDIVSQQWYYPEQGNLTEQFRNLKRIAFKLAFQDSIMRADSSVMLAQIDSLYQIYREEHIKQWQSTLDRVKQDSMEMEVHSIDAIVLPIFEEDIDLVASQFAYSNIKTQVFGNSDWYNLDRLNRNKTYINGLIFVSDNFLDTESWDYRQFLNRFRQNYKKTPDRYALLGYDNFNFILNALSMYKHPINRNNLLEAITSAPEYQGILKRFNIGDKRFNNSTRILKYVYGQIIPLN